MQPVDKFGREIFPHIFRRLFAIGNKLISLGYVEAKSKPNLFVRDAKVVTFFADMRGTDTIPIWSDPTPLFYWNWNKPVADLAVRQNILYIEGKRLQMERVEIRLSNELHQDYERLEEAVRLDDWIR
jgi:hypothetical protein